MLTEAGCRVTVMTAALLLWASGGLAQEPPALHVGSRIRVYVMEFSGGESRTRRLTGSLVGLDEKILSLESSPNTAPVLIARENITRVDLSVRRGRRAKGTAIGLVVGFAAAAVVGLALGDDPPGFVSFPAEFKALLFGGLFGAPIGATVGLVVAGGEQWQVLPSDRVRLVHDTARKSVGRISLSLRF
jgi:hypothetical protein